MKRPTVIHLIDDTTAGGVMRVLDHIRTAPAMATFADHHIQPVQRNKITLPRLEADVIVSHLAISWRALPMLLALRLRHPKASLVHVEHSYTEAFVALNVRKKGRFATLLRRAYGLFDRVVAVSEAQGKWLVNSGAVKARALCVIRSCVDLSAFRGLAAPAPQVRVIGAIGRLDRQKGFDTLIEAFRQTRNPNVALHIYGEGEEGLALSALAEGDPRIQFMGFVDPLVAMANVDAVVMPSRWEAYGLVAIEALAARRKLLVADIDGLRDHIAYGAQAVQDQSVAAWKNEIENLLAQGPADTPASAARADSFEAEFAKSWQEMLAGLNTHR